MSSCGLNVFPKSRLFEEDSHKRGKIGYFLEAKTAVLQEVEEMKAPSF
jgi:hypothetical protein